MRRLRPLADQRGGASVEMALMVPLLVVLLFGGFEAGHFVWTQHKLAEAVRDGARFASRLSINDLCDGSSSAMTSATEDEIKLLTRTGQLASTSAIAKVPGWTDAEVEVSVSCEAFVDTGIYTELGAAGAVVTVTADDVTYPSLFNSLGIIDTTFELSAKSNAPVIGL
jgi:Flp pilus assembly protein TadG